MARSPLTLVVLLALPLVGLAILLAAPEADVHWEHHPAHFWLVLLTAGLNAVLAYATGVAARRRGDRRVHLVSLSFLAASGFLALHALATPGVLLDKPNLGFVIATPVGLVLASVFAVLSAIDSEPIQPKYLERALLVLLALWAIVCLSFFPEVDDSVVPARLSSELVVLSTVGVACYTYAVVRYLDLYRERRSRLVLGFTVAFVLLAEAMVAVALGRNWQASWWEWHLLMLLAFAVIAVMAHQEGSEERFGRLYVDRDAQPVTVLFADLKGFTAFSEHHEPTAVSRMLDTLFGAAIPPIERYNGVVDRLIGDAVFATFVGDKHADRAARAALRIAGGNRRAGGREPRLAALPRRPEHGRGLRRRPRHGQRPHVQRGRRHRQSRLPDRGARPRRRRRDQRGDGEAAVGRRDRAARHGAGEGPRRGGRSPAAAPPAPRLIICAG